ncbi:MAG: 23S rRNA (pseudouridine(1915)-N(3))-methyltransferase RlmH [Burkholderiales bacterium]|nr:23S rRNA (pseudouridine(1915)-N(3))-methyltransferase RlmH [Burkholderiales bacterium]
MKLRVVAIGSRMPAWVDAAFADYARRMPRESPLELAALKPRARTHDAPPARVLDEEGRRLLAAVPRGAARIVLDERGRLLSTRELARELARWRQSGRDLAFVIGGADGLAEAVKRGADFTWSLTPLTLPHGLARVLVAEQLYRAASILQNHPYHRD